MSDKPKPDLVTRALNFALDSTMKPVDAALRSVSNGSVSSKDADTLIKAVGGEFVESKLKES